MVGGLLMQRRANQTPRVREKKCEEMSKQMRREGFSCMVVKKYFFIGTASCLLPPAFCLLPSAFCLLPPANAQIIPDATLPGEGSHIIESVDIQGSLGERIEGGALRGANLFHSFLEFNVLDGQRVYFANPAGIENILSRVTGSNGSDILGTLGVLGNANLFLVNPNGIVFGPNAQLDVAGSFVASTENGLNLSDGSSFSATNPEAPPLLAINVTPGIQWGNSQPQAEIVNQGNLAVGQDLTLVGSSLTLSGQLQAGRDLTLLATDTVQIRDSTNHPFIASAGGELLVQGNQAVDIFALNHPDSGLFSGEDLVLRSANSIIGDAHYWSGGTFQIEQLDSNPGSWLSPNDPVIRANGDVSFDSYVGASLHIFAGGSVEVAGNIRITGADATNGIQETVTLSDGTTVEIDGRNEPTLDIRAGMKAVGNPVGLTGNPTPINLDSTNTPNRADITINGLIFNQGGLVFLTNQYQPNPDLQGNITAKQISTANFNMGGNSGNIYLDSKGAVDVLGGNNQGSFALGTFANQNGNTGDAGSITVLAKGNISIASELTKPEHTGINASVFTNTANTTAGDSGSVQLTSSKGDITVNGGIFTNSTANNGSISGDTGDITLKALKGEISVTGNENGVLVTTTRNDNDLNGIGQTGDAGNITVLAQTISLNNHNGRNNFPFLDIATQSSRGGQSGDITFESQNPLNLTRLTIGTDANNGKVGEIKIDAPSLTLDDTLITTATFGSATAGEVNLNITGPVRILNRSKITTTVNDDATNEGGSINLQARTLELGDGAEIFAKTGSGQAGEINLSVTDQVQVSDSTISTEVNPGATGNGGRIRIEAGTLDLSNGAKLFATTSGTGNAGEINLTVADQVQIDNSTINTTVNDGATGNGGRIKIEAGTLDLSNGAKLFAETSGLGTAGNVSLTTDLLAVTDSVISASTSGQGMGGSLSINTKNSVTLSGDGTLSAETSASGIAGNVTITTPTLNLNDRTKVSTTTISTDSKGKGGNLTVRTNTLNLSGSQSGLFAGTQGAANAGNLTLNPHSGNDLQVNFTEGAKISASTSGSGNGGDLEIIAPNSVTLSGNGQLSSEVIQGDSKAGELEITANQVTFQDNVRATVSSKDNGTAGNLTVSASSVLVDNQAKLTATTDEGSGGNIRLQNLSSLQLSNSSEISASTGSGTGSNLTIQATGGTVALTGSSRLTSEANNGGSAGKLDITANQLILQDSSSATVSSLSNGIAGNLTVNAPSVVLDNQARLTATTQAGSGGNIQLRNLSSLQLRDRSEISASTQTGQAGSINLNQAGNRSASVTLNNSSILAQAEREGGNAGSIKLNTSQLSLANAAQILASNASANQGGDITLRGLESLQVNQSLISTSTQTGQAGNVTVEASDSVNLSGTLTDGRGGIVAEATDGGSAGNVKIAAPQVNIQEGAQVTVSSTSGQAGNLSITADTLDLNQGKLTAITGGNGLQLGANINLELADALFLSNESLISAEAIGEANGGNITINLTSDQGIFVAFPATGENGSDIIAKAEGGNGGRIDITSNLGLYGIRERQAIPGNGTNDIDASSDFGISGQITINSLAIDPSQGLSELPIDTVVPQLGQTCSPTGSGRNEFTVTGRDGLPPRPTDMLSSQQPLADLGAPVNEQQTRGRGVTNQISFTFPTTNSTSSSKSFVEAQGWIIDEQDKVLLTAHVPIANNQGVWQPQASCQGS